MPKSYSGDLRIRVIEMVQAGASRREAAEVFSLAGSTAVKWLQRYRQILVTEGIRRQRLDLSI
jgi:transposase